MGGHAITAVELHGRLGNQLFQYAMVRSMQGPDSPVLVESLAADDAPLHDALKPGRFRRLTSAESLRLCRPPSLSGKARSTTSALLRQLPGGGYGSLLGRSMYQERVNGRFDPAARNQRRPVVYRGFFQHEDYFKDDVSLILDSLAAPGTSAVDARRRVRSTAVSNDVVAVVIRAGSDYQRLGWSLPLSWYTSTVEQAASGLDTPQFLVFSDIALCAEMMADSLGELGPALAVTGLSPVDQLHLIADADHVVTSDTSFGWWGAWLGDALRSFPSTARVTVPDPWCDFQLDTAPPRWRRVPSHRLTVGAETTVTSP